MSFEKKNNKQPFLDKHVMSFQKRPGRSLDFTAGPIYMLYSTETILLHSIEHFHYANKQKCRGFWSRPGSTVLLIQHLVSDDGKQKMLQKVSS